MCGRTLQAGAVSAMPYVQKSIGLARAVLAHSPHACLRGLDALERGLLVRGPSYFNTEKTASSGSKGCGRRARRPTKSTPW